MKYYDYLTEFIFVEDMPEKSDVIFIPGSRYGELAVRAAQLYRQGMADRIIPSGKFSVLARKFEGALSPEEYVGREFDTESQLFSQILMDHGVPSFAIFQEREAVFTYENAILSRKLMEEHRMMPDASSSGKMKAILVCQAYHAKRSLMYYQLVFPQTRFFVCPVETMGINRNNWHESPEKTDVVLGEVERCGSQFHDIIKGRDKVLSRVYPQWSEKGRTEDDKSMYF